MEDDLLKVAIVGVGAVGSASAFALMCRGCARKIVLLDKDRAKAQAIAADMESGTPLMRSVEIQAGEYADLADAAVVFVTAGINEKTGGAIDRSDPLGRLKLAKANASVYSEVVPKIVSAAPKVIIVVVTDPPDPLAELTRRIAQHDRVLSTGTYLDTLRFKVCIGERLGANPSSVEASVLGEHGTSAVLMWDSARLAGVRILDILSRRGENIDRIRTEVEKEVRFANIAIIEGNGASQFGIGIVVARLFEHIALDERAVIPIGSHISRYGTTLSLLSTVGRNGICSVFEPEMSDRERAGLENSAAILRGIVEEIS